MKDHTETGYVDELRRPKVFYAYHCKKDIGLKKIIKLATKETGTSMPLMNVSKLKKIVFSERGEQENHCQVQFGTWPSAASYSD